MMMWMQHPFTMLQLFGFCVSCCLNPTRVFYGTFGFISLFLLHLVLLMSVYCIFCRCFLRWWLR
uniref:Uncharacterized protein n=1 Tax=Brassica oleracea TaxID=3712 RepID=A0A3P6H856_BRAOL|nr:unnamed protein product [Brassica oleracea]